MSFRRLPAIVAHADWSVDPAKRWLALARLGKAGRYLARLPEPAGPLPTLLERLARQAGPSGTVFLGVDFDCTRLGRRHGTRTRGQPAKIVFPA